MEALRITRENYTETFQTFPFGPPRQSGVYMVIVKQTGDVRERVLYIGSSKNVHKRVLSKRHIYMRMFMKMDSVKFSVFTRTFLTDEYVKIENEMILLFKPLLNKYQKSD